MTANILPLSASEARAEDGCQGVSQWKQWQPQGEDVIYLLFLCVDN